jgi:hypothetical protein
MAAEQAEESAHPLRLVLSEADHERLERCARERRLNKASDAKLAVVERNKTDSGGGK